MNKIFILLISLTIFFPAFAQENSNSAQTGLFKSTSTITKILGPELANSYAEIIGENEDIKWEIQVPANYNPNNPPGILVYVSPQNQINPPIGWMKMIEDHNLIWITATMSGNKIKSSKRILKAMLSLGLMEESYKIDPKRVYITGFSGGGRIASIIAMNYPHIFKGAIYNCGANFWDNHTPARLDLIKNNRFVFITGTDDFNLIDTKKVYRKYKKADVKNTKLMIIANMAHKNPRPRKFAKAIEYLDNNSS